MTTNITLLPADGDVQKAERVIKEWLQIHKFKPNTRGGATCYVSSEKSVKHSLSYEFTPDGSVILHMGYGNPRCLRELDSFTGKMMLAPNVLGDYAALADAIEGNNCSKGLQQFHMMCDKVISSATNLALLYAALALVSAVALGYIAVIILAVGILSALPGLESAYKTKSCIAIGMCILSIVLLFLF